MWLFVCYNYSTKIPQPHTGPINDLYSFRYIPYHLSIKVTILKKTPKYPQLIPYVCNRNVLYRKTALDHFIFSQFPSFIPLLFEFLLTFLTTYLLDYTPCIFNTTRAIQIVRSYNHTFLFTYAHCRPEAHHWARPYLSVDCQDYCSCDAYPLRQGTDY